MNAENPVIPGAQGPYAYPVNGVPGQAQGGHVAPIDPTRAQPSAAYHQEVRAMNQQAANQQDASTPRQHGVAPPAPHPKASQVASAAQGGTVHSGAGAATTRARGVSQETPVRASLKKGSGSTGSIEQGSAEESGVLGGFKRLISRNKSETDHGSESSTKLKRKGGPRRVRAMLTIVDPWSIMKLAFLLSIAMGIMFIIATSIVWSVLNQMGVFSSINEEITTILGEESETTFLQFFDRNKIMSAVILLSVINSILMTGLATIGAFLYNLVVKLVGGVYITLTDE